MKKISLSFFLIASITGIAVIFPIKESSAVKSYEWLGTPETIDCLISFKSGSSWNAGVTIGADGKIVNASIGGSSTYAPISGKEVVCNGIWGLCSGTDCKPTASSKKLD